MITGRNKRSLEDHFDRAWELEAALEAKGDRRRLERVQESDRARRHALHPPGRPARPRARRAVRRRARRRPAVRGAARRRPHRRPRPAAAADDRGAGAARRQRRRADGGAARARCTCTAAPRSRRPTPTDVVADHRHGREAGPARTRRATSRSSAATCCTRAVFDVLRRRPSPAAAARSSSPTRCRSWRSVRTSRAAACYGVVFRGRRYDTGDRLDYLKAVVRLASERADLGPDLRAWLSEFVADLPARQPRPAGR